MKIKIDNVKFSYSKKKEILKGVSCEIEEGLFTALLGPNGSGKTTLVKCLNKINIATAGDIFLDEKNIKDMSYSDVSKKIGYVPQVSLAKMSGSVMEFVMLGRRQYLGWAIKNEDLEAVADVLEQLNIEHLANQNYSDLSGGQRQKVLIARALMQDAQMYIFDEPTSNLDIRNEIEILDMAADIVKSRGRSIAMVVHDLNMALHYADKAIVMKDGEIITSGNPKDVLTSGLIKEVYGVDAKIEECGYVNPFYK